MLTFNKRLVGSSRSVAALYIHDLPFHVGLREEDVHICDREGHAVLRKIEHHFKDHTLEVYLVVSDLELPL